MSRLSDQQDTWRSITDGLGVSSLKIKKDGNPIYDDSKRLWAAINQLRLT